MIPIVAMAPAYDWLAQIFGEHVAPYVGLGVAGIIAIAALTLYDHIPQHFIIPIGVVGWIVTLALGYWFLNIHTVP
jgi:hypothetical protein